MVGLLALLFILVPVIELYVMVQVAHLIGVLPTIALVMIVSAAGAWLCKREGIGLYRRIEREIGAGQVPGASLVDGFLVLFAGALLLTPGFVTDFLGLCLLLPPVRFAVRSVLARSFARKAQRAMRDGTLGGFGGVGGFGSSGYGSSDGRTTVFVYDATVPDPGRGGPSRPADGERIIDVEEATYRRPDGRPDNGPSALGR